MERENVKITVNGDDLTVPGHISVVKELLQHFELTDRIVMVELNHEVIDHSSHHTQPISEGDQLQLVQFVGGG